MQAIKIIDSHDLHDLSEFKRGMIGLLKLLMFEAIESQRLDHYAMYKTMRDLADGWQQPTEDEDSLEAIMEEDEEAIARMILNFPRDHDGYPKDGGAL